MTKPFSLLRSIPQRRLLPLTLVTCTLTAGCQSAGFSTALSGKKPEAQTVSSTESAQTSEAGLPEPTNTATSNGPLSLSAVDEHLRLGEEELARGNYRQAQTHFEHVLQKHPEHVKAHHRLGVVADKLNDFQEAEQHYLTALAGDSRNAALLSDLGYSYFMQGRHADAERYLLESRKVDPKYDTAIANLGLLYGSTGRKQEALALFRQIGDDEQVQAIMKQIDGGSFGSAGAVAANTPVGQQSSAVTAQTSVQQSAPGSSQGFHHDPTQDFAEQLRKAREELRRAEEQFARHQQSNQAQQQQNQIGQPTQLAAQQHWNPDQHASPSSQSLQPSQWQNQPMSGQPAQSPGAMAGRNASSQPVALQNAPATFGPQNALAPLPEVTPGPRRHSGQPDTAPQQSQQASAAGQSSAAGEAGFQQTAPSASSLAAQQVAPGQSPWDQPASPTQPQHSADPSVAASNNPQASPPPTAWGRQYATSIEQAGEQTSAGSPQAIQQLSGTHASPGQQQPVEHAFHTQDSHNSQNNINLAAGQNAAGNGNAAAPGSNPYDAARRQAALLGLQAGPGQAFPYIQRYERVRSGAGSSPGSVQQTAGSPYDSAGPMSSAQPAPAPAGQFQQGTQPQPYPQQQVQDRPQPTQPPQWQHQPQPSQQQQWQQQSMTDGSQGVSAQPSESWGSDPPPAWGQQQSAQFGASSTTSTQNYGPAPQHRQPSQVTPLPYYERQTHRSQQRAVQTGYQDSQPAAGYPSQQTTRGAAVPQAYSNRQTSVPAQQQPALQQPGYQHHSPQQPVQQQQPQPQPNARPYTGPMIVPGER